MQYSAFVQRWDWAGGNGKLQLTDTQSNQSNSQSIWNIMGGGASRVQQMNLDEEQEINRRVIRASADKHRLTRISLSIGEHLFFCSSFKKTKNFTFFCFCALKSSSTQQTILIKYRHQWWKRTSYYQRLFPLCFIPLMLNVCFWNFFLLIDYRYLHFSFFFFFNRMRMMW